MPLERTHEKLYLAGKPTVRRASATSFWARRDSFRPAYKYASLSGPNEGLSPAWHDRLLSAFKQFLVATIRVGLALGPMRPRRTLHVRAFLDHLLLPLRRPVGSSERLFVYGLSSEIVTLLRPAEEGRYGPH
jgi:hypothetical protein